MKFIRKYESFGKFNAIKKIGNHTIEIDIQGLYDEMSVFDEDEQEYKDKYDESFVDYLDKLIIGKYVSYTCLDCFAPHEGILVETSYEENDVVPSNTVRVKFRFEVKQPIWFHTVNSEYPIIVDNIKTAANRFDL